MPIPEPLGLANADAKSSHRVCHQQGKLLGTDKLSVCGEIGDVFGCKDAQELDQLVKALLRVGVASLVQQMPKQGECDSLMHDPQHPDVNRH